MVVYCVFRFFFGGSIFVMFFILGVAVFWVSVSFWVVFYFCFVVSVIVLGRLVGCSRGFGKRVFVRLGRVFCWSGEFFVLEELKVVEIGRGFGGSLELRGFFKVRVSVVVGGSEGFGVRFVVVGRML